MRGEREPGERLALPLEQLGEVGGATAGEPGAGAQGAVVALVDQAEERLEVGVEQVERGQQRRDRLLVVGPGGQGQRGGGAQHPHDPLGLDTRHRQDGAHRRHQLGLLRETPGAPLARQQQPVRAQLVEQLARLGRVEPVEGGLGPGQRPAGLLQGAEDSQGGHLQALVGLAEQGGEWTERGQDGLRRRGSTDCRPVILLVRRGGLPILPGQGRRGGLDAGRVRPHACHHEGNRTLHDIGQR